MSPDVTGLGLYTAVCFQWLMPRVTFKPLVFPSVFAFSFTDCFMTFFWDLESSKGQTTVAGSPKKIKTGPLKNMWKQRGRFENIYGKIYFVSSWRATESLIFAEAVGWLSNMRADLLTVNTWALVDGWCLWRLWMRFSSKPSNYRLSPLHPH